MNQQKAQGHWIAVLALTAIALYLCWLMLKPFVGVLELATVLVIVFYPTHKRLAKRIKRPGLSALISCLLVIIIFVLPLTFLAVILANELSKIGPTLPSQLSHFLNTQTPIIGKVANWINARLSTGTVAWQEFMVDQLRRTSEYILGLLMGLMGNILSGIVKAFFVMFTMYYLFRDGDQIVDGLKAVLPLSKSQNERMFNRTQEVVSASIYGVVSIAVIQGCLGGFAFWLLGIPSPVLWAVLLTFICMIPIAGSFLVWLPLSIFLMSQGLWTKATLLLAWGIFVVSTVDNFLRPKLIRNQTKLHELLVFFSVLGGMSVFGLLGIVLGPVMLAITLGLLDTFRDSDEELPYRPKVNRVTSDYEIAATK